MRRDIRGLTRVSSVPIFVVTIKLRGSHARRKAGRAKAASGEARIGFSNGDTGRLPASSAGMRYRKTGGSAFSAMRPGQLIVVKSTGGDRYALRNIPEEIGRASSRERVCRSV